MALGALVGRPGRSGRGRFGGAGGRLAVLLVAMACSALASEVVAQTLEPVSISGNPAATDFGITGTGWLGRTLGLKPEWGITLGGVWLADTNLIMTGGEHPGGWTNNQALILGLGISAEKLVGWQGASFGF